MEYITNYGSGWRKDVNQRLEFGSDSSFYMHAYIRIKIRIFSVPIQGKMS